MSKDFLCDYSIAYKDLDEILYVVPIQDINMWLEKRSILEHYLVFIQCSNVHKLTYMHGLSDSFFTSTYNNFFSAFDNIVYDEKHKGESGYE